MGIRGIKRLEILLNIKYVNTLENCNTRVCKPISVPQITRLLLGDATISSKTDPCNGSKMDKRSYGKVRNNKTMLKILSLIQILYLKQKYSATFLQFKFEKSSFSNKFFSFIFRSKMIVHIAEKDQIKYFAQN